MRFDHVGIPTTEKKPGTQFGAATRVWITDAHKHPFRDKPNGAGVEEIGHGGITSAFPSQLRKCTAR